ncbi:MAG: ATP-binding protein [Peptoniphilaceae bacterium]|nr:ATP-binding protein [Peptoniphilaceae bacterium]MDY6085983.1 ATP-binding protein [Peptoniphilaceae bacterium]
MVRLILGASGSGKTTQLIEEANEAFKTTNGHVVFVDRDDDQMLQLDHSIRLINMEDYHIDSFDRLYGLLAGVMARDYDIQKIYIDDLHKDILHPENLESALTSLVTLGDENNTTIVLALSMEKSAIPEVEGIEIEERVQEA